MGIYSNAELIFGLPIIDYEEPTEDNDYDPPATPFWSADDEYWIAAPSGLKIHSYGHYEDPDNSRAILSPASIKTYSADCWTPQAVEDIEVSQETIDTANYALRMAGLPGDFNDARWYLVASVG